MRVESGTSDTIESQSKRIRRSFQEKILGVRHGRIERLGECLKPNRLMSFGSRRIFRIAAARNEAPLGFLLKFCIDCSNERGLEVKSSASVGQKSSGA